MGPSGEEGEGCQGLLFPGQQEADDLHLPVLSKRSFSREWLGLVRLVRVRRLSEQLFFCSVFFLIRQISVSYVLYTPFGYTLWYTLHSTLLESFSKVPRWGINEPEIVVKTACIVTGKYEINKYICL